MARGQQARRSALNRWPACPRETQIISLVATWRRNVIHRSRPHLAVAAYHGLLAVWPGAARHFCARRGNSPGVRSSHQGRSCASAETCLDHQSSKKLKAGGGIIVSSEGRNLQPRGIALLRGVKISSSRRAGSVHRRPRRAWHG